MATVAAPPPKAPDPPLAPQADGNLVNDPPPPPQTDKSQRGRWEDEWRQPSPGDEMSKPKPHLLPQTFIIPTSAGDPPLLSRARPCAAAAASPRHTNTPTAVKGRTDAPPSRRFPSAAADVADFGAHPSMRVLFSLSDVHVFACGAALESSAVYQRLNKRPLDINPFPHHLPA